MKHYYSLTKQHVVLFLVLAVTVGFATLVNAETNKLNLKVGDEAYVCNCGPECGCMTMSLKPGNCVCGKPLVKATVVYVEGDWAAMKIPESGGGFRLQAFKTVGKYACACAGSCDCHTISQKPGKCACGQELKEVK